MDFKEHNFSIKLVLKFRHRQKWPSVFFCVVLAQLQPNNQMISFSVSLDVRYAFAVVAFVARVVGVYYFAAVGLISVLRNESDFKFLYTHKYTNTHNRKNILFAWVLG